MKRRWKNNSRGSGGSGISFCGALAVVVILLCAWRPARAGMDVMTNQQLAEIQGGDIRVDISEAGYYGNTGDQAVTVVRFAADIYTELYAHIGSLRLGHYDRTTDEMGNMVVLDSNELVRYRNYRDSPTSGDWDGNETRITTGTPATDFGLPTGPEWSQWDVNWEHVQAGTEDNPLRMYGLIFRTEFRNWGEEDQELRRIVVGSNQVYGYSAMRPLVTSGYLSFNLGHLPSDFGELAPAKFFQLVRDPMADMGWQLSSIQANPTNTIQEQPSTRELWMNTNQAVGNEGEPNKIDGSGIHEAAEFDADDHGAFISLDFTDGQFRGWNIIGGVNEYEEWPNFESPMTQDGVMRDEEGGELDYPY